MRVALISDLHGNLVALRAVLADIEASKVDRIVCLGDVATLGPAPREVLDTLHEIGCAVILGNHDEFMIDTALIRKYTEAPPIVAAVDGCRESLDRGHLEFIRGFGRTLDVDLDGAVLGLFHGSPRSNMEDLLATTAPGALDEALGDERPVVMAGGHTHLQMLRQHRGTLLVNPGSVGMPFETYAHGGPPRILAHAEYAIVESDRGTVGVTLRRVPLDRGDLLAAIERWDSPLRDYLVEQYQT